MAVATLNDTDLYVLKAIYNRTIASVFEMPKWQYPEVYEQAKQSPNPKVRQFLKKYVLREELVHNFETDYNYYLADNMIAKSFFKLDELGLVQVDWLDFVMHDFTAQGIRLTDMGIQRIRTIIPREGKKNEEQIAVSS